MKISDFFDEYDFVVSQIENKTVKSDRFTNETHLINFLCHLEVKVGIQHIGYNWLQNYLTYQLDYWRDKTVKYGSKFDFKKIYAKKSLDRYLAKSDDFNWYMARKNLKVRFISRAVKEELPKTKRLGKIALCLEFTDLYNGSFECLRCADRKLCKTIKNG